MNITVSNKTVITDHQCIRCGLCTSEEACPIPDTVELRIKNYEVKHDEK
jgi:Fe-S-cluster-containing hydrogenase component 2